MNNQHYTISHLFSKHPIPEHIPEELERAIRDFSSSGNSEDFLRKSFDYLTQNWGGYYFDSQIQERWTHTWYITLHQRLYITLNNGEHIDIDPWNYQFCIPYGRYGKGFDSMKILTNK